MTEPENHIVAQFKRYAASASFHYADDTGAEWGAADAAKNNALQLFDDNPELQDEMRQAAKGQLWSLEKERPEK